MTTTELITLILIIATGTLILTLTLMMAWLRGQVGRIEDYEYEDTDD